MKFNEIYIAAERLQFEEMLMKENLKEMYDYLGYEKFNNYVQNSELNEDFKHKVKNFGKVAALNAALLAGSLGLASCTPPTGNNIIPEDTPIENPVEDDYTDDEEETEEEEAIEEAPELLSVEPLEGYNKGESSDSFSYTEGLKFKFKSNMIPNKVEVEASFTGGEGDEAVSLLYNGDIGFCEEQGCVIIKPIDIINNIMNKAEYIGEINPCIAAIFILQNNDSGYCETKLKINFLFGKVSYTIDYSNKDIHLNFSE